MSKQLDSGCLGYSKLAAKTTHSFCNHECRQTPAHTPPEFAFAPQCLKGGQRGIFGRSLDLMDEHRYPDLPERLLYFGRSTLQSSGQKDTNLNDRNVQHFLMRLHAIVLAK